MKITNPKPLRAISSAVSKYAEFISPTYGPAGKKILIATLPNQAKAVDDGYEASQQFEIENEFENAVVTYIKEAAAKTNTRVGDGTTTAVILTSAIVKEVIGDMNDLLNITDGNYHAKVKEIEEATKEAIAQIREKAKDVKNKVDLYKIALNSYNNEEIAKLVSETIFKVGTDGLMLVQDSQGVTTDVETVDGFELEKGSVSPYFATSDEGATLSNPSILLFSKRVESFEEIAPALKKIMDLGKREIVVIADGFSEQALNNFIVYKLKGVFTPLLLEAPSFGEYRKEVVKDIAAITGATVIDTAVTKPDQITLAMAGSARKVIWSMKTGKTTIAGGNGLRNDIQARISTVEQSLEGKIGYDKENHEKRLATLKNGMSVIKVGATTEAEQKAIKAKVEDCVNATRIAFKHGVVKGAGKAFTDIKTSSEMFNRILEAPRKQLEANGKEYLDENVTDPAGVLIAALETASSIACGLLTMGGIVTTKREKKDKEAFDY